MADVRSPLEGITLQCACAFLTGEEIACLSIVCKPLMRSVARSAIWRRSCRALGLPSTRFNLHCFDHGELRALYRALRQIATTNLSFDVIDCPRFQSSCDDPRSQSIDNVLDRDRATFWSSSGSASPDIDDCLIFRLLGVTIVRYVSLTPFKAYYQQGMTVYAPKQIRVIVTMFEADTVDAVTFCGEWMDVENVAEEHVYDLGRDIIIGGFVRIELRGRWAVQLSDGLFYVSVRDVFVRGAPIGAVPDPALIRLGYLHAIDRTGHADLTFEEFNEVIFRDHERLQRVMARDREWRASLEHCWSLASDLQFIELAATVVGSDLADDERFRADVLRIVYDLGEDATGLYLNALVDPSLGGETMLCECESIELGKLATRTSLNNHFHSLFSRLMSQARVTHSEELGDVFAQSGRLSTAMSIYAGSMIIDKVLSTCALICAQPHFVPYLILLMRDFQRLDNVAARVFDILATHHHRYIGALFLRECVRVDYIDDVAACALFGCQLPSDPRVSPLQVLDLQVAEELTRFRHEFPITRAQHPLAL